MSATAVNTCEKRLFFMTYARLQKMSADPPGNDYEAALTAWLMTRPDEADSADDADPFAARNDDPAQLEATRRVREFVRARFDLPADAAILVSEVACKLPGCPPLETVVAFWTKDESGEKRHHFKLFKALKQIAFDDLPFAWLKESLVVPEGFGCECC